MAYRGEFAWQPDEVRWVRTASLAGVALVAWALGFFFGRVSAWIVPVSPSQIVTVERVHLRPLAIPADAPASKLKEAPAPTRAVAAAAPSSASDSAPQVPQTTPIVRPQAREETAAADEDMPRPRSMTAASRYRSREDASEDYAAAEFGEDAIRACERRYASFRRSDGTYQPFSRPTRELCPLLR